MDLVEVVRGPMTSDDAVESAMAMAPFRLGDFSGLDVTYNARLHMFKTTGDERYRPSAQLEAKVKAGKLGRKTGEGWYKY
jgi:3-hydroxybutyryl-CoA dehydrogenase